MTSDEFRRESRLRSELADVLSNETLQQAIAIITAQDIGKDATIEADALVSVRVLSQRVGREQAFTLLQELTLPLPKEEKPPPETFGTGHTVEEFDQTT